MANMLKNPQGNSPDNKDKQKLETKQQWSGSKKPWKQPRLTISNPKKSPQKVLQKRGKKGSKDKSSSIQEDIGMHTHTHVYIDIYKQTKG